MLQGAASLPAVLELLVPRAETLEQLAEEAMLFYAPFDPADTPAELVEKHLSEPSRAILRDFAAQADGIEWNRAELSALMKATLAKHGIKMPELGIPLRVAVTGRAQTPAVDVVLELLGKKIVLDRLHCI